MPSRAPLRLLLAACVAHALVAAMPTAHAFARGTTGSLAMHDDPHTPATLDVADCTFWVRGAGFAVAEGTVEIHENHGRGGSVILQEIGFNGTRNGEGTHDFAVGPVTLHSDDPGYQARVFVQVTLEEPGPDGGDPLAFVQSASARVHCGQPFIPCIDDLVARAQGDGAILLSWGAADNATHYFVSRSSEDLPKGQPDFETLANTTSTTFLDSTAQPGVAYLYEVSASDGAALHARSCPPAFVTAVPFFGAPTLAVVAVAGVVGAYAWARRPKA